MGNYLQGSSVGLAGPGSKFLAKYKKGRIEAIRESHKNLHDIYGPETHAVDEEQFEDVFGLWIDDTEPDFKFWAGSCDKANVFVCLCGMATFCNGKLDQKLDFVFQLFDFDNSSTLCFDELVMLMRCVLKGMCQLTGLPLNLKREEPAIKMLANTVFYYMDSDSNKTVEKGEFVKYVLGSRPILDFLHKFEEGTDMNAAIKRHREKWHEVELRFNVLCQNNLAELRESMDLIEGCISQPPGEGVQRHFTIEEKIALTEHLDCQGKVSRFAFEALAKGLCAFDVLDVVGNNFVYLVDLHLLVHIKDGKQPDPDLLMEASKRMGDFNNDDDVISRLEWITFCALPKELGDGYYDTFSNMIKTLFDNRDLDKSGQLDLEEFRMVLYDGLVSVTPASVKEAVAKNGKVNADQAKKMDNFLVSMASSLANEIFDLVGVSKRASLEWLKIKTHLSHIWERKNEVMRWLYDHQTDHFARMFAFDTDKSGRLDLKEIQVIMFKTLSPSIQYKIISEQEAMEVARQTANEILDALDADGDNHITPQELEKALATCLDLERNMLNRVEEIRQNKIDQSMKTREDSMQRMLADARSKAEPPKTAPQKEVAPIPEAAVLQDLQKPETAAVAESKPKKKKKAKAKAPGGKPGKPKKK